MNKYVLIIDNTRIEFLTEEDANLYKINNDILSEIIVEPFTPIAVTNTPQAVTPRQMRIALVMSGIPLSTIEAMINSLPEPDQSITRITWEYSIEFQRNNPLLVGMAPALGLTTAQVDALFALAGTL